MKSNDCLTIKDRAKKKKEDKKSLNKRLDVFFNIFFTLPYVSAGFQRGLEFHHLPVQLQSFSKHYTLKDFLILSVASKCLIKDCVRLKAVPNIFLMYFFLLPQNQCSSNLVQQTFTLYHWAL